MFEDYQAWYNEHEDFFTHLFNHNSIIFERINDVINVMAYIENLKKKDINEEIEVIFDAGYAYLFNKVTEIELYLKKYFNNDLHKFLNYEVLINYSLYLDDLKEVLEEKEQYSELIKKGFDEILDSIENILLTRKHFNQDIIDEYNIILLSVIPSDKEFLTTPEVFIRIGEELQI
jgi:hypothetical protein